MSFNQFVLVIEKNSIVEASGLSIQIGIIVKLQRFNLIYSQESIVHFMNHFISDHFVNIL